MPRSQKTEKIFFISRAVGHYFAIKHYAICKECALPWQEFLPDAGYQRVDLLCVDKNFEFVIIETKSSWEDFRSDHKWQSYLDWCNQFYFAAEEEVALRISKNPTVKACRIGVLAVDKAGTVKALRGSLKRRPPAVIHHQDALLLSMVFRLSPFEFGGKLRKNSCFFPNEYFKDL